VESERSAQLVADQGADDRQSSSGRLPGEALAVVGDRQQDLPVSPRELNGELSLSGEAGLTAEVTFRP